MTPTTVVAAVNARLGTSLTAETVHTYLLAALSKITNVGPWSDLWTTETASIVQANTSVTLTGDILALHSLEVADATGTLWSILDPVTFDECREAALYGSQGTPRYYERRGNTIHLSPKSNAAYTLTAWYWQRHPQPAYSGVTPLAILFGEEFFEAVVWATIIAYLTAQLQAESSKAIQARTELDRELSMLMPFRDSPTRRVRYHNV
jgi:hypothetical protein